MFSGTISVVSDTSTSNYSCIGLMINMALKIINLFNPAKQLVVFKHTPDVPNLQLIIETDQP